MALKRFIDIFLCLNQKHLLVSYFEMIRLPRWASEFEVKYIGQIVLSIRLKQLVKSVKTEILDKEFTGCSYFVNKTYAQMII